MRVVIQRVSRASVTVEGYVTGAINEGLAILVGIKRGDTVKEAERMVNKVLGMRMWSDQNGNPWKKNVKDLEREILFISQFTLYARMKDHSIGEEPHNSGNSNDSSKQGAPRTKPDYSLAMSPEEAKELYKYVHSYAKTKYAAAKIQDGAFGEHMLVDLVNDGPVTITLDFDPLPVKDPNSKRAQKLKQKKEAAKANVKLTPFECGSGPGFPAQGWYPMQSFI